MQNKLTPSGFEFAIEDQGFSVIPGVANSNDISNLEIELNNSMLSRSRAGIRHVLRNPAVAAIARGPQLMGIASRVLGGGATPFRATLFDKSRLSNWLVVWHQDTALPLRKKVEAEGWGPWSVKDDVVYAHAPARVLNRVLALRLHLDRSDTRNGPLRVLPGTHKLGVLSDDSIRDLAEKISPCDCVVPKGGVLAMRPLIVHASSKSQSEEPRRVLHIEFAASTLTNDGLELAIT